MSSSASFETQLTWHPFLFSQASRDQHGRHYESLRVGGLHRRQLVSILLNVPGRGSCILIDHSVQKFLDIAAHDAELSNKILAGPNEFSRVGRSRAQQNDGEDERPAAGATKEEVVSLLETLAALH